MFAEALARPSTVTAASRRITKASRTPSRERWRRGALWAVPALLLALAWAGRALWPRGRSASRGGGLDPKHIAVLYFEDLTPKKELAYLADGLTEALIADLKRVSGLAVISRNGVAPCRGSDVPSASRARAAAGG